MANKRIGMNVTFAEPPAPGLAILFDGQRYELLGSEGKLLRWTAPCRVCGTPFEIVTGSQISHFIRTCEQHRAKSYAQRKREAGEI